MITDIIKKLINKRREKKKIARLINRVNSRLKNFSNSQYAITDTEKRPVSYTHLTLPTI